MSGLLALLDDALSDGDPPPPASLTNALGLVADHLDDALVDLGHLELEQGDEEVRMGAAQDDLRALADLQHVQHVGLDALARAKAATTPN